MDAGVSAGPFADKFLKHCEERVAATVRKHGDFPLPGIHACKLREPCRAGAAAWHHHQKRALWGVQATPTAEVLLAGTAQRAPTCEASSPQCLGYAPDFLDSTLGAGPWAWDRPPPWWPP